MTRRLPLAAVPFATRRTPQAARVGPERWMVPYADLVTLLFAFFVVLYALTRVDPAALARFAQEVPRAFAPGAPEALPDTGSDVRPSTSVPAHEDERGLALTLPVEAFFHPGTATLRAEALPLIEEVGTFLATLEGSIVVEGHAAEGPTGSTLYATPWELSAARAARVARHLQEACGLAPARLSAVGRGASSPPQPSAGRDPVSAERLEILIVP